VRPKRECTRYRDTTHILHQAFSQNAVQLQAARDFEGPLVLLAGPGSGKTRVLTHRVAYIHRHTSGSRWRVLALTFTNKAASEMKQRLAHIPGYNPHRAFVGTIHSFCSWVLRSYGCYCGLVRHLVVSLYRVHSLFGRTKAFVLRHIGLLKWACTRYRDTTQNSTK
jgi:superfamily I DNA/RNA helicase